MCLTRLAPEESFMEVDTQSEAQLIKLSWRMSLFFEQGFWPWLLGIRPSAKYDDYKLDDQPFKH